MATKHSAKHSGCMEVALAARLLFGLCVLSVPVESAIATPSDYIFAPADFSHSCNANGYIIGLGPQASLKVLEDAAKPASARVGDVYLGRSCDAYNEMFGWGKWCWAEGGFLVDLPSVSLEFPGQRPHCPRFTALGEGCLC